jgi:hypothetical protein
MPIETTHPEYNAIECRWQLVRDIVRNDAKKYIRDVDVEDTTRNRQYKEDAILTNFTALTLNGLKGLVFRKPLTLSLPNEAMYLLEDSTGTGININQLSQFTVGEILQTGRIGVLVDYPKVEERLSQADVEKFGNAARLKPYTAENIINWKTRVIGSRCIPYLIVLREFVDIEDPTDQFSWIESTQYRVLHLTEDQIYEQYVYTGDGDIIDYAIPRKLNGQSFNEIPFKFIGSENNDWAIDWIPLYDMAIVNLGHYRNSADLEESGFICGQPYPVINIGETSVDDFKAANPSGVVYGSRGGLILQNGNAQLLQANENQLIMKMMQDKLEQAAAIGARLIAPAGGRETAEAARIRFGSQNSALYTITSNINWAFLELLGWVCDFMGGNRSSVKYKLNDQFYDETADPNLIAQQILMVEKGILPKQDVYAYGRKTGFIDTMRTDEQLEAESEAVTVTEPSITSITNPED